MAIRTFLGSGDTFNAANNGIQVFGASGAGTEKLLINSGVTGVITDANIERIDVAGNLADYKFVVVAGTGIQVQNTAGTVIGTIPSLNQATTLAFANGSASLVQTGSTAVTLGGQAISTTTATPSAFTTTALGTSFNTTVTSGVTTTTTPTTPTIVFSAATASLTEGNSGTANMPFIVNLSSAQSTQVTVSYSTTGITATAGSDFTNTTGTLIFAAGETTKTIQVPIVGDTVFETNETFTVNLTGPVGATISSTPLTSTGTITNDDTNQVPVVAVVAGSMGSPVPVSKDVLSTQGLFGDFTVTDLDTALLTATITSSSGLVQITGTTVSYAAGNATATKASSIQIQGSASALSGILDTIQYQAAGAPGSSDNVVVTVTDGTTTTTKSVTALVQTAYTLNAGTSDLLAGTSAADVFNAAAGVLIEAGDTITGGDGTDVITFAGAAAGVAQAANTLASQVTSIEIVNITSAGNLPTLAASKIGGLTTLNLTDGGNHGFTVSALSNTQTINFLADSNAVNTIDNAVAGSVIGTQTVNVGLVGDIQLTHATGGITTNADLINVSSLGTSGVTAANAFSLNLTASAAKIVVTGTGDLTISATTTNAVSELDASAFTGKLSYTSLAAGTGLAFSGGLNNDTVVGTNVADILIGNGGNDTLKNETIGVTASALDTMTGGAGNDTFVLYGDSASAANYSGSSYISDFSIGSTATTSGVSGTDILALSATKGNYSAAGTAVASGITAGAAGTTVLQSLAQNASAAAYTSGADLLKLTTGVAFDTSLQVTFNNAIGSATVTGLIARDEMFFSLYDTTNSRMVIGLVDAGAASTVIATADVVTLIGTVNMTAADYAAFSSTNLAIVA